MLQGKGTPVCLVADMNNREQKAIFITGSSSGLVALPRNYLHRRAGRSSRHARSEQGKRAWQNSRCCRMELRWMSPIPAKSRVWRNKLWDQAASTWSAETVRLETPNGRSQDSTPPDLAFFTL